jgi:hypothetical protein
MTKMGEDDVITIAVADAERITNALRLSDMVLRAEFEGDELADWDPQDLQALIEQVEGCLDMLRCQLEARDSFNPFSPI